jgi:hypothetical protein
MPGVTGQGTWPGGQVAPVHRPLTQVWFESQQTPLQQTGFAMPQHVLPQGVPTQHRPLWQVAGGSQHTSPHSGWAQQTCLPAGDLRQSFGRQQVGPPAAEVSPHTTFGFGQHT